MAKLLLGIGNDEELTSEKFLDLKKSIKRLCNDSEFIEARQLECYNKTENTYVKKQEKGCQTQIIKITEKLQLCSENNPEISKFIGPNSDETCSFISYPFCLNKISNMITTGISNRSEIATDAFRDFDAMLMNLCDEDKKMSYVEFTEQMKMLCTAKKDKHYGSTLSIKHIVNLTIVSKLCKEEIKAVQQRLDSCARNKSALNSILLSNHENMCTFNDSRLCSTKLVKILANIDYIDERQSDAFDDFVTSLQEQCSEIIDGLSNIILDAQLSCNSTAVDTLNEKLVLGFKNGTTECEQKILIMHQVLQEKSASLKDKVQAMNESHVACASDDTKSTTEADDDAVDNDDECMFKMKDMKNVIVSGKATTTEKLKAIAESKAACDQHKVNTSAILDCNGNLMKLERLLRKCAENESNLKDLILSDDESQCMFIDTITDLSTMEDDLTVISSYVSTDFSKYFDITRKYTFVDEFVKNETTSNIHTATHLIVSQDITVADVEVTDFYTTTLPTSALLVIQEEFISNPVIYTTQPAIPYCSRKLANLLIAAESQDETKTKDFGLFISRLQEKCRDESEDINRLVEECHANSISKNDALVDIIAICYREHNQILELLSQCSDKSESVRQVTNSESDSVCTFSNRWVCSTKIALFLVLNLENSESESFDFIDLKEYIFKLCDIEKLLLQLQTSCREKKTGHYSKDEVLLGNIGEDVCFEEIQTLEAKISQCTKLDVELSDMLNQDDVSKCSFSDIGLCFKKLAQGIVNGLGAIRNISINSISSYCPSRELSMPLLNVTNTCRKTVIFFTEHDKCWELLTKLESALTTSGQKQLRSNLLKSYKLLCAGKFVSIKNDECNANIIELHSKLSSKLKTSVVRNILETVLSKCNANDFESYSEADNPEILRSELCNTTMKNFEQSLLDCLKTNPQLYSEIIAGNNNETLCAATIAKLSTQKQSSKNKRKLRRQCLQKITKMVARVGYEQEVDAPKFQLFFRETFIHGCDKDLGTSLISLVMNSIESCHEDASIAIAQFCEQNLVQLETLLNDDIIDAGSNYRKQLAIEHLTEACVPDKTLRVNKCNQTLSKLKRYINHHVTLLEKNEKATLTKIIHVSRKHCREQITQTYRNYSTFDKGMCKQKLSSIKTLLVRCMKYNINLKRLIYGSNENDCNF